MNKCTCRSAVPGANRGEDAAPTVSIQDLNVGSRMNRLVYGTLRITLPMLLAGLTACTTLGPDFETPAAAIEAQWLEQDNQTLQTSAAVNSEWWKLFNDPVLNTLVQQAYEQNLSLQIAGLRILEARAQLGIAIGNQYPQLQELAGSMSRVNQRRFQRLLGAGLLGAIPARRRIGQCQPGNTDRQLRQCAGITDRRCG
jgi:hypothetical protein